MIGKKSSKSNYAKKKEIAAKDHFISMKHNIDEDKLKMQEMDEEELQQAQAEKAKLKAMFREDVSDDQFCPIIIKSNQAGTLETLITET